MLNPMQQSEPSKIALFSAAQYAWKQWKSEEEAKKVNDIAFNFVETGSLLTVKHLLPSVNLVTYDQPKHGWSCCEVRRVC